MNNAANNSQSRRAFTLGALLFLAIVIGMPTELNAQTLRGDQDVSLQRIRVQDFNGGMGKKTEQTQRLADQSTSITNIQNGTFRADLNTNFGNLDLVFEREVNNAWNARRFSGCVKDVDITVTFQNGEMISTLNSSDSSGVSVESFNVQKRYRRGCMNRASGSLRFYIDIASAAAAGTYSGQMTIEVNPVY